MEGGWGSALPTAIHWQLRNLNRWFSARTISIFMEYFCLGFRPETATANPGNILLQFKKSGHVYVMLCSVYTKDNQLIKCIIYV